MVASFVAPYVDSIFARQGRIEDVHVAPGHELLLLYGNMLHSMDDGPVGHLVGGYFLHIIVVKSEVIQIPFVLDDHVMMYNVCLHYHTQLSFVHVSGRTTNDGKAGL